MTTRPEMRIERLELHNFRSYGRADVSFPPGFTAILGPNGHGKTNLLEAVAFLSRLSSFRGAPPAALVAAHPEFDPVIGDAAGRGAAAVVRGAVRSGEREVLIEAEVAGHGRPRVLVNRQRLARRADLLATFQVSVFTPEDLVLVKGGPAVRRDYLDEVLVATKPANTALVSDVERIIRQRNALLKQVGSRLNSEAALTLDVWDERLARSGEQLVALRRALLERLMPYVAEASDELAGIGAGVSLRYRPSWHEGGLAEALRAGRDDDLRRKVSLVGPHRDDVEIRVGPLEARHQASQGEQRSLAFALRLAAHRLVIDELGMVPVLLLDDVFSELDPSRSSALLRALPAGQVLLTSATALPADARPDQVLDVADGVVTRR